MPRVETKCVLLVFSRQDTGLRDEIEEVALHELTDATGRAIAPESARDSREALAKFKANNVDMAIIGHAIASDAQSPVAPDGGLGLCATLRDRGVEVPLLLLVPLMTTGMNTLLERCRELDVWPYSIGDNILETLRKVVARPSA